ncbi:MAG: discoidin domain-containing protein [Clostridia bacterium]|nr:discoidin domain-containing protein [Clostridia bacterium]
MKKIISMLVAVILLITCTAPSFAAWDGYTGEEKPYTILDTGNVTRILDTGLVPVGKGVEGLNNSSIYWEHSTPTPQMRILKQGKYDFSQYNSMWLWMFSAEKTNSKFMFIVGKQSDGYHSYTINVNWVGWKKIIMPFDSFSSTTTTTWDDISYIDVYAHGWGMTPNPKTVLYLNTIYLEKNNEKNSVKVDEKLLKTLLEKSTCFYAGRNQYLDKNEVKYYKDNASYGENGICYVPDTELAGIFNKEISVDTTGKVKINGKTTNVSCVENNGVKYVSAADAAKELGKNVITYKNLVVASDDKAIYDIERNTKMLDAFASATTANKISADDITDSDIEFTLEKWSDYLTGGNSSGDSEFEKNLKSKIEKTALDLHGIMNKGDNIPLLWGNAPCASTATMGVQYTNLYKMALAWATPGTSTYQNEQLKNDILFGIEWGYENLFGEDEINNEGWRDTKLFNWFEWQITVPDALAKICLLMRDIIPEAKMKKYLRTIDYFTNEHFGILVGTHNRGANVAHTAYPFIISQLLQKNTEMVAGGLQLIIRDLGYSYKEEEDGQHPDGSYRFHYWYAMNGTYGSMFLKSVVPIINIMSGTKFEIIDYTLDQYGEWLAKGYDTSIYNGRMMSVFRGRSPGGEAATAAGIIADLVTLSEALGSSDKLRVQSTIKYYAQNGYFSEVSLESITQYNIFKAIMEDDSIPARKSFNDFNMFYNTDKAVWQNDNYAMAISMSSSRTSGWESINGENKKGWYQGDGMVYLYTADQQDSYESPFWQNVNNYRLPGTTVDTQVRIAESIQDKRIYQSSQPFVGGVELGEKYGVAAMFLESCHNETSDGYTSQYGNALPIHYNDLVAQKSYFVFDDEMVHLGAGINSTMNFDVETIVENRKSENTINFNTEKIEKYKVASIVASDTPEPQNVAENVLDGDLGTKWAGENTQNLILDLGEVKPVGMVGIAVMYGTKRTTKYDISLSVDGVNYSKLFEGQSSGKSDMVEVQDMKNTNARYIKIDCYGNSEGTWNSITEVEVYPPRADGKIEIPKGQYMGNEVIMVNGEDIKADYDVKTIENTNWLHLENSAGYVFLKPATIGARKTNSLVSFNEMWIKHGKNPVDDTYAYVTLPLRTPEQTKAYYENPDVEIIANDKNLQAVKEKNLNITGMVFWKEGTCGDITANIPCIVMMKETEDYYEISVSDPTHMESSVSIKLAMENISFDKENSSVYASFDEGVLTANTVEKDGQTISARFNKIKK